MTEPIEISIAQSQLIDWLNHIKLGAEPKVKFSDNLNEMLEEAYKMRGNELYYLNHRIRSFLPPDIKL